MNPKSKAERLDKILAGEEQLTPSSGFLAGVMERVHEEAQAPKPIPFPWKRLLPGFVLAAGVFGWALTLLIGSVAAGLRTVHWQTPELHAALAASPAMHSALGLGLAAAISLAAVFFSLRLAGNGGLR
jgi:hypothetical protein